MDVFLFITYFLDALVSGSQQSHPLVEGDACFVLDTLALLGYSLLPLMPCTAAQSSKLRRLHTCSYCML